jgi:hypothetical protein
MEASGVVRTPGRHVTRSANVPAINQPNAGQRYMRPLRQDAHNPLEEFIHTANLGQFQ